MTKAELFSEYGSYHKDRRNRACHAVGIPLIVFGLMALLHAIVLGSIDLAIVTTIAVSVYYATIDLRGALISALAFVIAYLIAVHAPWYLGLGAFVLGWIFQLIGHRFEGKKPKFLENAIYLLIGPLFFFEESFDVLLHSRA